MRTNILRKIADIVDQKPWVVLAIIVIITIITGMLAATLRINPNLQSVLPENNPIANEYDTIFEKFEGVNTIFVVVEGKQKQMVEFARNVSPGIENLGQNSKIAQQTLQQKAYEAHVDRNNRKSRYFTLADYKKPVDFIKDHGMMLMDSSDLAQFGSTFEHPNLVPMLKEINNSLESKYIHSDQKLSTSQRERNATQYLDGLETFFSNFKKGMFRKNYQKSYAKGAVEGLIIGSPYLLSPDRKMLLIRVKPTFSIMDMGALMPAVNSLEKLINKEAQSYNVKAGLAGGPVLARDEMRAINEDSYTLTILALIAVFIIFVIAFRMFSSPFMAIVNLMIGIIWSLGINALIIDQLNLFTAMFSVILVGLGIDFSIHIISLFSESKFLGKNTKQAVHFSLMKAGKGIMTGGITTAAAFLTLLVLRSKGMRELGLVTGVGLIVIMITTLFVLPTLLILRDKIWEGAEAKQKDLAFNSLGDFAHKEYKNWKIFLPLVLLLSLGLGFTATKLQFDYNYLNMEPKGLQSIKLNKKIIDKFNMTSDVTRFTANSIQQCYKLSEKSKSKSTVSRVQSIADYVPPKNKQAIRKSYIGKIHKNLKQASVTKTFNQTKYRKLLNQLYRLEANIIEMQDMAFIGGKDLIDDKASRLVGDPNLSRALLTLKTFIGRTKTKNYEEKLNNITELLQKGIKGKPKTLQEKLDSILLQVKKLREDEKEINKERKKNLSERLYQKLKKIYQQPRINGKLSYFISQLKEKEDLLSHLNRFNQDFGQVYKKVGLNFSDTSTITIDDLPNKIKDKYISKDGSKFLITVYPQEDIWHVDYLKRFYIQMKKVTPRLAGTPPMFYQMMNIIGQDGKIAAILTVIVVFIFLLFDFQSWSKSVLAMIPLLSGFIWMLGLMVILGLKLTLVNVMGLPLILGIGIDDGVHILHRYEVEGRGNIKEVYKSTGKAIIMTSLTTMLSFGSLVFATYRGYGSLGRALFFGVGTCLLTTIFFIPSILGIIEDSDKA